ncbi:MAG: Rrf2 family transcriptional regulator [Prolixibacteraceae bacterium]|nr:Rrf2 family transcriptional regulator [Prolixibacteraceae bacterium]
MKFSTRTRYGIRTVLEIALCEEDEGIYQKDISKNQEISYKYLDHIVNSLKVAGIIAKAGGRKSGYVLTRKPEEITTLNIHNAFEPEVCVVDCIAFNYKCERENICVMKDFWIGLNTQVIDYLKSKTVKDLMEEQRKKIKENSK